MMKQFIVNGEFVKKDVIVWILELLGIALFGEREKCRRKKKKRRRRRRRRIWTRYRTTRL